MQIRGIMDLWRLCVLRSEPAIEGKGRVKAVGGCAGT